MNQDISLRGLSHEEKSDILPDNLILLGFRGSVAHGMYVPQENPDSIDDKDIMGVFVGPKSFYLGYSDRDADGRKLEVREKFYGEWDSVCYEVRKFISLLEKGNPNVLSMLWLPDKHLIWQHGLGGRLIVHRNLFATKQVYHSFSGYAYGQFKRMTHYKFEGYMGNKRKELVDRFGYDCKNAAHLIRLLRMSIEFMTEGYLHVERADAEQLLEIKRGEWSLDRVKTESERLFKLAEEAYIRSTLPARPDREKIEQLTMGIIGDWYGWKV